MTRPHIAAPVVLMAIQGVNELADVQELFTASHRRSLTRQKSRGYESFQILNRILTDEEIENVRTKIAQKTHDYQKHNIHHLILIHSNPHLLRAACTSAEGTRNPIKKFFGQDSIKNCLMAIARVAAGNKRKSPNENVTISLPELRAAYEEMQQEDLTTLPGAAAGKPSCTTRTQGAHNIFYPLKEYQQIVATEQVD